MVRSMIMILVPLPVYIRKHCIPNDFHDVAGIVPLDFVGRAPERQTSLFPLFLHCFGEPQWS